MPDRSFRAEQSVSIKTRARFQGGTWLLRHLHALVFSFGQLVRQPANTILSASVIGIALTLPMSLFVLLDNVKMLTHSWEGGAQLSLYLHQGLADTHQQRLIDELHVMAEIERVLVITPAQALEEYQQLTGFDSLGAALGDENPLPGVLVLFLGDGQSTLETVDELVGELARRPEVELVQSDLQWIERLHTMVDVVQRGIGIVAVLFGFGVLLIIGNTIRMGIQNRHDEIEITKLVGATDAFIRRPFLYSGFWYGLLGAAIAWILVASSFHFLAEPVRELATLYNSEFRLAGASVDSVLTLLGAGASLGLAGSWFAVNRQLRLFNTV
jgi:cell division transport system permease protein